MGNKKRLNREQLIKYSKLYEERWPKDIKLEEKFFT